MKHLLCIDYGQKHIGLAIAVTQLAEPLKTVLKEEAIPIILDIIKEKNIDTVIIGLSENIMANLTKEFADTLAKHTDTPIVFHDETLSSRITRQKMSKAGLKKKKLHNKIDHLVAAHILQDYIDEKFQ